MAHLVKKSPEEPVIILWSDHLVKDEDKFRKIIQTAGEVITHEPNKIIFIGHKPRFASENLGWIEYGNVVKNVNNLDLFKLENFRYKPDKETANQYYSDNKHSWNLGYFVTTPQYLYSQYEKLSPDIYDLTEKIKNSIGKVGYTSTLKKEYEKMPTIHFDKAVLEKMEFKDAYVINDDIQWSDLGAWEALKEALETTKDDNVTLGNVRLEESTDNLIYNYDNHKMIVGIDLNDFLVVNTKDVLLVTKKTSVPKVKKFVEKLEEEGGNDQLL